MKDTAKLIYKWIKDNYGESEADEPSWDYESLAGYLDKIDLKIELEKDICLFIENIMRDYASNMPDSFYKDILDDVIETSAYGKGYYSESDIALAFQRTVAKKFDVEI